MDDFTSFSSIGPPSSWMAYRAEHRVGPVGCDVVRRAGCMPPVPSMQACESPQLSAPLVPKNHIRTLISGFIAHDGSMGSPLSDDAFGFPGSWQLNLSYRDVPAAIKEPTIRSCAEVFVRNIDRAIAVVRLAPLAAGLTGAYVGKKKDAEHHKNVPDHALRDSITAYGGYLKESMLIDGSLLLRLLLPAHPEMREAIAAVFASQTITTWTAFETLAGDLWENAVNAEPHRLARLAGNKSRIRAKMRLGGRAEADTSEKREDCDAADNLVTSEDEENTSVKVAILRMHRLTGGSFDLRGRMGSVLKPGFRFSNLTGIRQAYSCAFSKRSADVDATLADQSIDALNLVRNLIVHKGGVADETYVDSVKKIPTAPQLALNEILALNGGRIRQLVEPVVTAGTNLIVAVDKWLLTEREKRVRNE